MKVIVGLGNPGSKYQATKHNIGFITIDEIAASQQVAFNKTDFTADIAEFFINGEKIMLVKPLTFMNDSGRTVGPLMDYYQVDLTDLTVIYDDMDMPVGNIRLRQRGSAGGHNGIKSIIQHLGKKEFNRIRVGIGRPKPGVSVVNHVLSPFPKEEHSEILLGVKEAAQAAEFWTQGHDFMDAMNHFNHKNKEKKNGSH